MGNPIGVRDGIGTFVCEELVAIAEVLGFTSLNHTLSVLISRSFNEIAKTPSGEVVVSNVGSSSTKK